MWRDVWGRGALVLATAALLVGLGSCVGEAGSPTDTTEQLLNQIERAAEGQIARHEGEHKLPFDEPWIVLDGKRIQGDERGLENSRPEDFEMEVLLGEKALEYSEGRSNNVILLTTKLDER